MGSPQLGDFLVARIAEDEATARVAIEAGGPSWANQPIYPHHASPASVYRSDMDPFDDASTIVESTHRHVAAHITGWDPKRVLVECQVKRRIAEAYAGCIADPAGPTRGVYGLSLALLHLAAAYSDHPDYRDEWRP